MKPLKNKLIVAVNLSEKDDYEVTLKSGLKLFMRSNYGYDGRETNPVIAKVIAVGDGITDVNPDDILLVHYNSFKRVVTYAPNGSELLLGDMGIKQDGLSLFCLEYTFAWMKLDEQGNPIPLNNLLVVETIDKPELVSEVITLLNLNPVDKSYIPNTFKVVRAGVNCQYVRDGDTVICYDKSNLLIKYTFNTEMRQCYRMQYSDVLAIKQEA